MLIAAPSRLDADLIELRRQIHQKGASKRLTPTQLAMRYAYLSADGHAPSRIEFERVLGTNDLLDLNYLSRGLRAAQSVCRILIQGDDGRVQGLGTGFLVAPQLVLTNHHVLPDAATVSNSLAQFDYQLDADGVPAPSFVFRLRPDLCFHTSAAEELDFTLVAVEPQARDSGKALADFGFLRLIKDTGKINPGEWVTLIQHPNGEYKQIAIRENQLLRIDDKVLWYASDTAPGASGAPAMNDSWQVVALHHRGIPDRDAQGRIKTVDGRALSDAQAELERESSLRWIANEGIRISRVVADIAAAPELQGNALIQALLANAPASVQAPPPPKIELTATPAGGAATLQLSSGARIELPLRLELSVMNDALASGIQAASLGNELTIDRNYANRKGYAHDFLGESIPLPDVTAAAAAFGRAAINSETADIVLPYTHYSVIMNAQRCLAFVSAVNINGTLWRQITRTADVWTYDPRIPSSEQAGPALYDKEPGNFFDRGHLCRRTDPSWGDRKTATKGNNDTFHWTNCSPQHWRFNEGKTLWAGLEDYILSNTDSENIKASVFTGPVFRDDDIVHRQIPIPREFWKVVAVRTREGALLTSAYLVSQEDLVRNIDFEEYPVGAYRTFQTSVARIEELTKLQFSDNVRQADVALQNSPGDRELNWFNDVRLR
jgi:endonuclease G, mitochondrial